MSSVPRVSVLVTAFNRRAFIADAIESVLAQTFTDFEVIIVDDCSTDGTAEVARRYARDPRVQVYVNERNLGDYRNRNWVAQYARGEFLKYVDSDDIIYPHGLTASVWAMDKCPKAAVGLECPPEPSRPYPVEMDPREAYREHFFGRGLFGCGPTGSLIRTRAFREVGGFRGTRFVGDTELWLKLGARWPVVKLMSGLIWWRRHEDQEIRIGEARIDAEAEKFNVVVRALTAAGCPLDAEERSRAMRGWRRFHLARLARMVLREGRAVDAVRLFERSEITVSELAGALF